MRKIFARLLTLLTLSVPLPALSGIDDGLIAHYPLNGDLLDASGNARHLTGPAPTFIPDPTTPSRQLYRLSGRTALRSSAFPFQPSRGITVSGYLGIEGHSGEPPVLTIASTDNPEIRYRLELGAGDHCGVNSQLRFLFPSNGTSTAAGGPCVSSYNQAEFFAVTFDPRARELRYYVSYAQPTVIRLDTAGITDFVNATITVGALTTDDGDATINLKELEIHNRALSDEELEALYSRSRWRMEALNTGSDYSYSTPKAIAPGPPLHLQLLSGTTQTRNIHIDNQLYNSLWLTEDLRLYTPNAGITNVSVHAQPNGERMLIVAALYDYADRLVKEYRFDGTTGGQATFHYLSTDGRAHRLKMSSVSYTPRNSSSPFSNTTVAFLPNPVSYTISMSTNTDNTPINPERCALVTDELDLTLPCAISGSQRYRATFYSTADYNQTDPVTWLLSTAKPAADFPSSDENCAVLDHLGDLEIPCLNIGDTNYHLRLTPHAPAWMGQTRWRVESISPLP